MNAADRGDMAEVQRLLAQGADPLLKDGNFGTSTAADYAKRAVNRKSDRSLYDEIIKLLDAAAAGQQSSYSRDQSTDSGSDPKTAVPCPNCGQRLAVPLELQGNMTCPQCKNQFSIEGEQNNYQDNGSDYQNEYRQTPSASQADILHYLEVLGVDNEILSEEIKKAYKKRINEYHPDKVANLDEGLRQVAEEKTEELNNAYRFLKSMGLVK